MVREWFLIICENRILYFVKSLQLCVSHLLLTPRKDAPWAEWEFSQPHVGSILITVSACQESLPLRYCAAVPLPACQKMCFWHHFGSLKICFVFSVKLNIKGITWNAATPLNLESKCVHKFWEVHIIIFEYRIHNLNPESFFPDQSWHSEKHKDVHIYLS